MWLWHKAVVYPEHGSTYSELEACSEPWHVHNPQSFTKCLRQTLVFMWNKEKRESFNFCFFSSVLLVSTKKIFLGGGLGTRLYFYGVLRFSWPFIISRSNSWGNSYIPCLLLSSQKKLAAVSTSWNKYHEVIVLCKDHSARADRESWIFNIPIDIFK